MSDNFMHPTELVELESSLGMWFDTKTVLPDGGVLIRKEFIDSVGDMKIIVHSGDHPPTHFHVISRSRGVDFSLLFPSFEVYRCNSGEIDPGALRKVRKYFEWNKQSYIFLENVLRKYGRL